MVQPIKEFISRYSGTFIIANIFDKKEVVFIEGVEEASEETVPPGHPPEFLIGYREYPSSGSRGKLKYVLDCKFTIIENFPKNSLHKINECIIYFSRNAQRQWKRGVCQSSVSIIHVDKISKQIRGRYPFVDIWSRKFLPEYTIHPASSIDYSKFFRPIYNPFKVAIENIFSLKEFSQIISPDFYLQASVSNENEVDICSLCGKIASINKENKIKFEENNVLIQELKDFIRRNNINVYL